MWICPYPHGHLQATGTDAAGRKQYRYHDAWRARRDAEKFDDMVRFAGGAATAAPRAWRRTSARAPPPPAPASWPAPCGCWRSASSASAPSSTRSQNESYGLATMRKSHVRIEPGGQMVFRYPAKSGVRRVQGIVDEQACEVVATLKRRRGGGPELLAYKERGRWHDVRSPDINAYLKEATGGDFSAKDFRTWNATLLAAVALGVAGEVAATKTGRKRAVKRAIDEVAAYLGNTPAVCRASYIDPRVFDAYQAGLTIAPALAEVAEKMQPGAAAHPPSRGSRPRCSTCSTSARAPPRWSGSRRSSRAPAPLRAASPARRPSPRRQQPPHRRARRDPVDDDGEQHGGDRRPHHELLLGGAERPGADGDGEVVERADAAHAEPGRRTPCRPDGRGASGPAPARRRAAARAR